MRLAPRSPVARGLLIVAAVVAALILSVHFAEGPDGRAAVSLGELWWCAVAAVVAIVVELWTRRKF